MSYLILLCLWLLPVLLLLDWLQTLVIARHPEKWRELNPILGPHPSVFRVNSWFILVNLLSMACLRWAPTSALNWGLPIFTACELFCVVNNLYHGIGWDEW